MSNKISKTKYTYDDRKHIVELIEHLKNDSDYVAIFDILSADSSSTFQYNSNGVFLNLSVVSDHTLDLITKHLKKVIKKNSKTESYEIDVIPNANSVGSDRQYKLSNYEKNIIKQNNIKKGMSDKSDYKEMSMLANANGKKKTIKQTA